MYPKIHVSSDIASDILCHTGVVSGIVHSHLQDLQRTIRMDVVPQVLTRHRDLVEPPHDAGRRRTGGLATDEYALIGQDGDLLVGLTADDWRH